MTYMNREGLNYMQMVSAKVARAINLVPPPPEYLMHSITNRFMHD